ncbi:cation:dicarboxylate symporter family transporter [Frondihabitans australicus]|uniref:Na+/H+-dicarboxylate symporter n=1 Tax=Frondihabitans australicus TaxID=386892 RepID=A0A495IBY2_9MICO|nr:cation:dicarboxylase symporter family transporter [Frondihabitans australicus]RKR73429.1 Na+/H+-dicarboxylate symporter [Frondihabitans australicus]
MSAQIASPAPGRGGRFSFTQLNPFSRPLYKDLTFQVLTGMVVGVLLGVFVPKVGLNVNDVSTIFINLIQMVVGLIVFCTVTLGIAKVRDFGKVGRIAIKAMVYFEVITTFALIIGLVTINILRPGVGLHIDPSTLSQSASTKAATNESFGTFVTSLVPTSAIGAFSSGNILQILIFSVLFGCGVSAVGEKAAPLISVVETTQSALFWMIRQIMKLAPLAACAAIAFSVATYGLHTLVSLGALVLEFFLTVVLFFVLVLWPVSHYANVSLLKLMRYIRNELLLVIGTSSSESVFPQLTEKLKKLGVSDEVVGLVLPTAYSFNHDGTCLFFAATSVFLAQATDTHLGWTGQLTLMIVLLLTSKGGAGVAGSSIPILALTLAATHIIPVASVALILGVQKIMSAAFVFANITGNCVATVVVGKWEKAIDWDQMHRELDAGYVEPSAFTRKADETEQEQPALVSQ